MSNGISLAELMDKSRKPIRFGSYDPFDNEPAQASIRDDLKELLGNKVSECELEALIDATESLARNHASLPRDWRAEQGWLFQLAQRLMAVLNVDERKGMGRALGPLALLFIEELSDRCELPKCEIDWTNKDSIRLEFETCWSKARFGEGEEALGQAISLARREPVVASEGILSEVISTGYYLSIANGGEPFFIPIIEKVANYFGTSTKWLGNCVAVAEERGLFIKRAEAIPRKRARLYVFDASHEDLLSHARR